MVRMGLPKTSGKRESTRGTRTYVEVNYDRFGKCSRCWYYKPLTYSKEKAGWWCRQCEPFWSKVNNMRRTR